MIRKFALAIVIPWLLYGALPVAADYDAGQRAWDEKRYDEALSQWRAAADGGHADAMLALGRLFRAGLGAPQDYVLAHMWLNLAASRGVAEAAEERDALAEKMVPDERAEAQRRARDWRPEAARDEAGQTVVDEASGEATDAAASTAAPPPPRFIREAQSLLAALGYDPGAADGAWTDRTRRAYQAFLRDAGLEQADVLTRDALHEMRAIAAQSREMRATPTPGTVFRDCTDCPKMIVVPSGTFLMGSPPTEESRHDDEGPQHHVRIGTAFAVGVHEVTFREWDACLQGGGCDGHRPHDRWGRGDRPVINVSWHDAQRYLQWLGEQTGREYRLLSEAEWEYVARAGTSTPFHFGATISTDQANYNGDFVYGNGREGTFRGRTVTVGTFPANAFGLHDVHGNVWEWTQDCWNDSYVGAPSDGSAWERGICDRRVVRGGSWFIYPWALRSAARNWYDLVDRDEGDVGFRVARTLGS